MKAETYFTTSVIPRMEKYYDGIEAYYTVAWNQSTIDTKFDFGELTTNRLSFFPTLRLISRLFPIVILRDDNNIAEGLTIVGKKVFIDAFIEHFAATIRAVERDLEKISRPSKKLDRRVEILSAINDRLEQFTSYIPYDPRNFNILAAAREYRQSISTLRIKKSFYGK